MHGETQTAPSGGDRWDESSRQVSCDKDRKCVVACSNALIHHHAEQAASALKKPQIEMLAIGSQHGAFANFHVPDTL